MIVNEATREVVGRIRYELRPGAIFMSGEVLVIKDDTNRVIKTYEFKRFTSAAEWYAKVVAAKKGA